MKASRVLVCHNRYQLRGGEDAVYESEVDLLRKHGHEVSLFERSNDDLSKTSRLGAAINAVWSQRSSQDFQVILNRFKPNVIHVHNTFATISPSIYWSAAAAKIPVVQTLHNFRLLCPQAMLLRNGKVCEDCLGKTPWRGVMRACYRDSLSQSVVLAGMVTIHRAIGTWQEKVSRYIALNEFCRQKFIDGGLPAKKIVVKPNFVDFVAPTGGARSGFLFVGRLSVEKGVSTLASASQIASNVQIRVAGDGPQREELSGCPNIQLLGALGGDQVREEMTQAEALILPSIWYENFPRTLVEALGCGLPVIASRIGALAELIQDGVTGLHFEPGNANDLATKLEWAQAHPEQMRKMGVAARREYEEKYTAERNYGELAAIYQDVMEESKVVVPA